MLKDTWVDKKDGVDINSAEDINQVAHAVIDLEKEAENKDETGIHIGPEAPTNGEQIWIDTDEEGAEDGGTSIDVTAEVGQTIIVKEVDANGKPTKWESADYQPRTHYKTETVVLPETTGVFSEDDGTFILPFVQLIGGAEYKVVYNGVEYISQSVDTGEGEILFGNTPLMVETGDNGIPFMGGMAADVEDSFGMVVPIDGAETVTLSITQVEYTPIPREYLANTVYYIDVTGSGTTDDPYTCKETVQELARIYNSGQQMVARTGVEENGVAIYTHHNLALGRTDGVMFCFIYYMGSVATSRLLFQSADGITYTISGND